MKQGILINGRTRILYKKRGTGYKPMRTGERERKSCRGCIVGPDICALFLRVVKKGDKELEGVTDVDSPKRRNHIIKTFALEKKKDDVRKYVVRREIKRADKTFYKSPKIQRLVTEKRIRRRKVIKNERMSRFKNTIALKANYEKVLSQFVKERKAAKNAAEKEAAAAK